MENATRPSGTATIDQYISLSIAVTETAFWNYCDCVCDLYCLRWPNRSEHARKRRDKIIFRALKNAHIPADSTDIHSKSKAVLIEKKRIKFCAKSIENFFESGICGLAFHFQCGNANYLKKETARLIENYVKTGKFI